MTVSCVHCRRAPYDIYIGRGDDPATGRRGEWGNPFSHRPSRARGVIVVGSRREAVRRYRLWLWQEVRCGAITLEQLAALHGKRLGCWCAPDPCHGEVLAAAAAWAWRSLRQPQLFGSAALGGCAA